MNPAIVIPTFHTGRSRRGPRALAASYDHPTPLTKNGELPRCLQSLMKVRGLGQVIILVSAEPGIEIQATEKVLNITAQFPGLNTIVIGTPEHLLIQQRMEQLGLGKMAKEIGLTGYSAVRNLGLVVANVLGFDAVVFLDDDEVVDSADFLQNAMYGLGKLTPKGIPILAKTGFYYNSEGTYLSKSQDKWYNHFWQQGKAFNKWIEKAMRGPRLSRSNHVCGGCLALHKEAFKRLSFDPWIMRGEDLDYMLNLRMYGSDIWFDNKWSLRHLPPASASEGTRFRQDIYRWLYEYRKMEYSRTQIDLLQVKPASLEPYPGPFLEPGIERRIRITALLRSLARPDKSAYRKAAKAAKVEASEYAQANCAKYFEFQFVWPELMARMEGDQILRSALLQSAVRSMPGMDPARLEQVAAAAGIDPGTTSEIRMNVAE
ncbi:hypothetical protein QUW41_02550 [Slackia piriformis]|jgi:hypothetical protein|nr:hypothetical protein [Slackia piriformis]